MRELGQDPTGRKYWDFLTSEKEKACEVIKEYLTEFEVSPSIVRLDISIIAYEPLTIGDTRKEPPDYLMTITCRRDAR